MPGLVNVPSPANSSAPPGIWSKKRDIITFDHLQKFWSELPLQARQDLLRVDKQTLLEQARKNLYCSRCNGLLLEGFSQIVMHGKSLQVQSSGFHLANGGRNGTRALSNSESFDVQDDEWGGLAATKDGLLTLVSCLINSSSLKALQNVFDGGRAREVDREKAYPDACGGEGRGWISQGMANYGRGHGTRDTCALHTARLSCGTLVDFWNFLGEQSRRPLLRMKEEDFIEKLMYRFDSKRFCRDCRKNVIREFKELKEIKRMRKELRCTSWFCAADTAFLYEVSQDAVQADWCQCFADTIGTYHHFEWAIGTEEGKYDILDFKDVGMNGNARANGLNLTGLSSCFITLRACKLDGRWTEVCVKAHALKGKPCVHRRLVIGDGFVTITEGESIRTFFEHAEEAEEEEDDDAMDKDGNDLDVDVSRPQKHAKSPELAREFLLDAATVIFKEQVEKAYRESTARQNAHSIFVTLSLKLLEDRVHVACKEIITLEKQIKLVEEEEKEKLEEEERRGRRRLKEREKKLRRKERLKEKGKEREREQENNIETSNHGNRPTSADDTPTSTHGESSSTAEDSGDSISDPGDSITSTRPRSPNIVEELSENGCIEAKSLKSDSIPDECQVDGETGDRDIYASFILEQSKSTRRKLRFKKDSLQGQASHWYDDDTDRDECESKLSSASRLMNGGHRLVRDRAVHNPRNCNAMLSEKFHCSSTRLRDRYDVQSCNCCLKASDYRIKDGTYKSSARSEPTALTRYRGSKYYQGGSIPESCPLPRGKLATGASSRDVIHSKQVWEPLDLRRKGNKSNSDPICTITHATVVGQSGKTEVDKAPNKSSEIPGEEDSDNLTSFQRHEDDMKGSDGGFVPVAQNDCCLENGEDSSLTKSNSCGDLIQSSSSSDNCSSCLSEGDSTLNTESSSTSDSEDASPQLEARVDTTSNKCKMSTESSFIKPATEFSLASSITHVPREETGNHVHNFDNRGYGYHIFPPQQHILPIPMFPPTIGYHNRSSVPWSPLAASGLMPFPQPNHFVHYPSTPYGLPAARSTEFGIHYNSIHSATPLYNNAYHQSMYQRGNGFYAPSHNEQNKISNASETMPIANCVERSILNQPSNTHCGRLKNDSSLEGSSPCVHNGSVKNASESGDTPSFSLFHFGGPVCRASSKENSTVISAAQIDDTNSKGENTIEEYSLFASGTGPMFSIF